MNVEIVFYNMFDKKSEFELKKGKMPWYVITLLEEGEFSVTSGGNNYVSEKSTAFCFTPGTEFERKINIPISMIQVGFFISGNDKISSSLKFGLLDLPKETIAYHYKRFYKLLTALPDETDALIKNFTETIITDSYINELNVQKKNSDATVDECIKYFSEHISEKISIKSLAEKSGVSHNGLIFKFRKATGEAPLFTLLRIRLQLSKKLLLSGEKSIKEISDICGFSDEYHFSNSFKKFYGVAPTIYKKNAKK